jgi:hypothetical protein
MEYIRRDRRLVRMGAENRWRAKIRLSNSREDHALSSSEKLGFLKFRVKVPLDAHFISNISDIPLGPTRVREFCGNRRVEHA